MKTRYLANHLPRRPLEDARLKITRLTPKKLGLIETFQQVCKIAAEAIVVERVGIWLFVNEHTAIRCSCLYERSKDAYSEGAILRLADFPNYFEHLHARKTIPAENANLDPRTDELTKAYLEPLGIISLLDAAILHNDKAVGVVCHEHTGTAREWTTEERDFVGSVADLIAFKIQSAKLAEVQQQMQQTVVDVAAYQQRIKLAHMAAGVAHDFRNLLTIIKGYARMISIDSTAASGCQEMAEHILNASQKGEALTEDLMALSGNQAGHPVVVDVAQVIRQLLPLLEQTAGPRHSVATQLPEGMGRVLVDPLQLERIMINLVANSRDAMPEGGPITIKLGSRAGGATGSHRTSVIMEVSDKGTGIDPAIKEKIFEAFFTTKPRSQGTGLGLAIVKSSIELAGGQVELESETGKGTTFRIALPCVASGT